jgi:hypothetical protein
MIGIIAYGPFILNPGWEIADVIAESIPGLETPFEVEFAHASPIHAGAPNLAPVPPGKGARVKANLLVLKSGVSLASARDMLYRRMVHRVGDLDRGYPWPVTPGAEVAFVEIDGFAGLDCALYTCLDLNIAEILDDELTAGAKAAHLAQLALDSVVKTTYFNYQDGLAYLSAAKHAGVSTPLSGPYRQEVLKLSGGAPNLGEARVWIAKYRKSILHPVKLVK